MTQINYEILFENALRDVVRAALLVAEEDGLQGDCHFVITFLTTHPDVHISEPLRKNHPEKMTIIIQHQFWDLKTREESFNITLSFNGKQELLTVPFAAVTEFNDPSVGFGLQFELMRGDLEDFEDDPDALSGENDKDSVPHDSGADVVVLDSFRKKN